MAPVASLALVPRALASDNAAMARLMTRAEAGVPECREAMAQLYAKAGRAHVIGITGVPGSGKSTLVSTLTLKLRASGKRVGIIAVDPSSPYSGGSIMGDRILYLKILRRFLHDHGTTPCQIRAEFDTGNYASARLKAHTLKGAAGMIGARHVHGLATTLESALRAQAPDLAQQMLQLELARVYHKLGFDVRAREALSKVSTLDKGGEQAAAAQELLGQLKP